VIQRFIATDQCGMRIIYNREHTTFIRHAQLQFSASGRISMSDCSESSVPFVNGRARQAPLVGESPIKEHIHTPSLAFKWQCRT